MSYTPECAIYPIDRTVISYILEEWEPEAQDGVHFAWSFRTHEEAKAKLLQEMGQHGHRMAYRMYMSLDVWPNSTERV